MRTLRLPAKQDDGELISICSWIKKRYPAYEVKRDWFIKIDPLTDEVVSITDSVYEAEMGEGIWHRPDILVLRNGEIRCLIEIDGSIHRTFARGKTAKRNKHYEDAFIAHLIIDKYETPDVMAFLSKALPKFL